MSAPEQVLRLAQIITSALEEQDQVHQARITSGIRYMPSEKARDAVTEMVCSLMAIHSTQGIWGTFTSALSQHSEQGSVFVGPLLVPMATLLDEMYGSTPLPALLQSLRDFALCEEAKLGPPAEVPQQATGADGDFEAVMAEVDAAE